MIFDVWICLIGLGKKMLEWGVQREDDVVMVIVQCIYLFVCNDRVWVCIGGGVIVFVVFCYGYYERGWLDF